MATHSKVKAHTLAGSSTGAVGVILIWLLEDVWGLPVRPDAAAAIALLGSIAVGHLVAWLTEERVHRPDAA